MKSLTIGLVSIIASAFIVSGCNTVQGVGKDLQAGGKAINQAANDNHSNKNAQDKKESKQ